MEGGQLDCCCGCFGAIGDVGGEEELLRLLGIRGVERWNGWWPRRSSQRHQCGRRGAKRQCGIEEGDAEIEGGQVTG